jgi:hypothetical protein
MARARWAADTEADLEVIAPPGWDALPRQEVRSLSVAARTVIAAVVALACTLAGDVYALYRITSIDGAERLTGHLAEAQALERMRGQADQELRLGAMFPEDIATYETAVKALGDEHADRVRALAARVRGVSSIDSTVRRARRELAAALTEQERSIRSEIEHNGTLFDTLAEEFEEAIAAVERTRVRWGLDAPAALPRPFSSIEPTLAQWRKLLDVPSNLRLVVAGDDLTVVDLDSGAERVLSGDGGVDRVFGPWAVIMGRDGEELVDMVEGRVTPLGSSYLVPGPDGTTAWLLNEERAEAVEVRLPNSPTGARFDGWLIGDTGRHLVAFEGNEYSELPKVVLHDRVTQQVLRRLGDVNLLNVGRDALAWTDSVGALHVLSGAVERVVHFPDGHLADNVTFSPDGRTAAVTTNSNFAAAQVWLVPAGSAPQAVHAIRTAQYYALHWSPQGEWVVAGDGRRYYAISMADRSVHRIRMRADNNMVGLAP